MERETAAVRTLCGAALFFLFFFGSKGIYAHSPPHWSKEEKEKKSAANRFTPRKAQTQASEWLQKRRVQAKRKKKKKKRRVKSHHHHRNKSKSVRELLHSGCCWAGNQRLFCFLPLLACTVSQGSRRRACVCVCDYRKRNTHSARLSDRHLKRLCREAPCRQNRVSEKSDGLNEGSTVCASPPSNAGQQLAAAALQTQKQISARNSPFICRRL